MFLLGDFEKSLVVWHKAWQLRGNAVEVCTVQRMVGITLDGRDDIR